MIDLDNMAQITERRNQMVSTSTDTYNKKISDGAALLPHSPPMTGSRPGMPKLPKGGLITVFGLAIIPGIAHFFLLWGTRSTLMTLGIMVAIYAAIVYVHRTFADKQAWNALFEQDLKPSIDNERISVDFGVSLVATVLAFMIVTILYCSYVGLGPAAINVYLPAGGSFMRFIYWSFYIVLHVLLGVVETAFFFFVILYYTHYNMTLNGILAGIYGLSHFAWIVLSIWGVGWIIFFTLASSALGWIYLIAVKKESFFKGLAMRLGIGLSAALLIMTLSVFVGTEKIKSPQSLNTSW